MAETRYIGCLRVGQSGGGIAEQRSIVFAVGPHTEFDILVSDRARRVERGWPRENRGFKLIKHL